MVPCWPLGLGSSSSVVTPGLGAGGRAPTVRLDPPCKVSGRPADDYPDDEYKKELHAVLK